MANTGVRDEAMNIHVYLGATMCIGTGGQIGSNVSGEDTRADTTIDAGGDVRLFCSYPTYASCRTSLLVGMSSGSNGTSTGKKVH